MSLMARMKSEQIREAPLVVLESHPTGKGVPNGGLKTGTFGRASPALVPFQLP
jgi:hypothetical protein